MPSQWRPIIFANFRWGLSRFHLRPCCQRSKKARAQPSFFHEKAARCQYIRHHVLWV